jgi:hypothetical protein
MYSWWICADATDLPLATGHGDVDEAAGVSEPLLGAALGGLLLLLGLNLLPVCQPQSHSVIAVPVLCIAVRIVIAWAVISACFGRRCEKTIVRAQMEVCLPWLPNVSCCCFSIQWKGVYVRV